MAPPDPAIPLSQTLDEPGAVARRRRLLGVVLVVVATTLYSTAGLFVRAVDLDVWQILGWRSFFGALSLLAIVLWQHGRGAAGVVRRFGLLGWIAVPISAVSMYGYVAALTLTSVANVTTVYATLPFLAVGLAYLWMGERPTRRVVLASLASFVGVLVTTAGSLRPADLLGIAMALMMTAGFAFLLVLVRRAPHLSAAAVNGLAALLCVLACLPLMPAELPGARDLAILALFGVSTSALAYVLFLQGVRYIPPGEAGLISLFDVALGPFWVWLVFSEDPGIATMVGAAIVVAATAWYLSDGLGRPRHAPPGGPPAV